MKAAVINQFGDTDVLKFEDISVPSPKPGYILIKVLAAVRLQHGSQNEPEQHRDQRITVPPEHKTEHAYSRRQVHRERGAFRGKRGDDRQRSDDRK